jgi:hypothetical protein
MTGKFLMSEDGEVLLRHSRVVGAVIRRRRDEEAGPAAWVVRACG